MGAPAYRQALGLDDDLDGAGDLVAQGAHLGNLFAFRRGKNLIAVVPRLTLSLANQWEDTRLPLPGGTWQNIFTQETLSGSATANELFRTFPVALLRKATN